MCRSRFQQGRRAQDFHHCVFAFCSPILQWCGICPQPAGVTSSWSARDVVRTCLPRLRPCHRHGSSPSAHSVVNSADTCPQTSSGAGCPCSLCANLCRGRLSRGRDEASERLRGGTQGEGQVSFHSRHRCFHQCCGAAGTGREHHRVVARTVDSHWRLCGTGEDDLG